MTEEQAKARFFMLQAIRLVGTVMAVLGVMIEGGKGPDWFPRVVALPLVVIGMVCAFYLPVMLARRWKSQNK